MYWISLGLLNRCPQFSNFTLQNREKSSVLKGLTQDDIKSYFYGNDCFEPKIAIISYLNLLKTIFWQTRSGIIPFRTAVPAEGTCKHYIVLTSMANYNIRRKLPILSEMVWADSQQVVRPSRTHWVDMTYIGFSHRDRC